VTTHIDIFNGDADGICALLQLRLQNPLDSRLMTGAKREIQLLKDVKVSSGDMLTVLDISMNQNHSALLRLLNDGASVLYIDHHAADEIPDHPKLKTHINTSPETCTSLLVHEHIGGDYYEWAIVGAYGDNMGKVADSLAKRKGLNEDQMRSLRQLGRYLNYNSYGLEIKDLHFHPAELYRMLLQHESPISMLKDDAQLYDELERSYQADMACVESVNPVNQKQHYAVYLLPAAGWANRVSGVWGNALCNAHPDRAHAIATTLGNGNYRISLRAPLSNRQGADRVCGDFPSGGGRAAAAGVNELPSEMLDDFVRRLDEYYL
jgi:single-stranded DNA-specific DHH superfamily exonuclease